MTRILVVDDNPEDREFVRRCLEEADDEMEVEFAEDGEVALAALARAEPDVVLTDLRMPNLDGLQLVERVAADYPVVPVILMTARGSEQIAVQALHAGASSYVPKSDLRDELCDTVWQVLELAETRRSRSQVLRHFDRRETCLTLASDMHLVGPVVAFLQDSLERIDFANEGVRAQIGVALMEGLANAIVRGNLDVGSELRRTDRDAYDALIAERMAAEPYRSRTVAVTATESADRVEYRIVDQGEGFDPVEVPDPTAAENLLAVSGRGIMLMRTFMDTVEFSERGNAVTLVKHAPGPEDEAPGPEDEEPGSEKPADSD